MLEFGEVPTFELDEYDKEMMNEFRARLESELETYTFEDYKEFILENFDKIFQWISYGYHSTVERYDDNGMDIQYVEAVLKREIIEFMQNNGLSAKTNGIPFFKFDEHQKGIEINIKVDDYDCEIELSQEIY